jgi:hypothetical protein
VHIVDVRSSGDDLAAPLNQMRTWLDGRRIEPVVFRLSLIPGGTIFRMEFRAAGEARAFARAFGGTIISEPGGHPLAA